MSCILETNALTKRFQNQTAVQDVSLRIRENTVYGPTQTIQSDHQRKTAWLLDFSIRHTAEQHRLYTSAYGVRLSYGWVP